MSSTSVNVKIVSRLNFELRFKLKLRQCLHSDTADRLHLMCCNAQKSKESLRALLHAKKLCTKTHGGARVGSWKTGYYSNPTTKKRNTGTIWCPQARQNMLKNTPWHERIPMRHWMKVGCPTRGKKKTWSWALVSQIFPEGSPRKLQWLWKSFRGTPSKKLDTFFNLDTTFEIDSSDDFFIFLFYQWDTICFGCCSM